MVRKAEIKQRSGGTRSPSSASSSSSLSSSSSSSSLSSSPSSRHRSNNGRVAHGSLQGVMRRAGLNPTDIEVEFLLESSPFFFSLMTEVEMLKLLTPLVVVRSWTILAGARYNQQDRRRNRLPLIHRLLSGGFDSLLSSFAIIVMTSR